MGISPAEKSNKSLDDDDTFIFFLLSPIHNALEADSYLPLMYNWDQFGFRPAYLSLSFSASCAEDEVSECPGEVIEAGL